MDSTTVGKRTRKRASNPIALENDAQRKRRGREDNTPAAENARQYDRDRQKAKREAKGSERADFTLRHEHPIPFPPDGTLAEYQIDLLRGVDRTTVTCWRADCDRHVNDNLHNVDMSCRAGHTQPKDKQHLMYKPLVPLKLTNTATKQTFLAVLTDRAIATVLYGGKDVLDPRLSDYQRKLHLSSFKHPIKKNVTTRHVDGNTFVTYIADL